MRGFESKADLEVALGTLRSLARPLAEELVSLKDALGRALARDMVSEQAVPSFDKSAMDGFALRGAETFGASPTDPVPFRVVGEILPGAPSDLTLGPGEAVRIMTGGAMPEGADSVLMAEYAKEEGGRMLAQAPVVPGRNIAEAGEDVREGDRVLEKGRVLRPQDLGILASIRVTEVPVTRRSVVGVLATGNELVEPGSPEAGRPGRVVNSCRYVLEAMVTQTGGVPLWLGSVPDDREALRQAMVAFAGDILVTTGATSVGREDYLPGLLDELGELMVHGVNIRPASPTAFGRVGSTPVVLLPGNPVAAFVGFDVFVRPALQLQMGLPEGRRNRRAGGRLTRKLPSALNRTDFVRVRLTGEGGVEPVRSGGSGILSSLTRADGFVIVPRDAEGLEAGTEVEVYLF